MEKQINKFQKRKQQYFPLMQEVLINVNTIYCQQKHIICQATHQPILNFIQNCWLQIQYQMNHLQRAWLKVLSPVVTLVNDKMAKRSGLIGKLGRFFAFGPRQFGYHPINRYLAILNRVLLQNIPLALHRYSFIKHLNENGYISARPHAIPSLMGMLCVFASIFYFTIPKEFATQEGTSLQVLTNAGLPAHYSSLNDRVSAHYTQINSLYGYEMMKRFEERAKQIQRSRAGQSDKTRKTKYAREGYSYIEPHTKTQ